MSVQNEKNYLDDFLRYEIEANLASREKEVLISGQSLLVGAVVGKITASGKLSVYDEDGSNGTETAYGIMIADCDASGADTNCVVVARDAVISKSALKWTLPFTSGGTHVLAVDEGITGVTSAATGTVKEVTVTSGSWAAGTAVGNIVIDTLSGEFQDENIKITGGTNDATVSATGAAAAYVDLLAAGIVTREEA